MAKKKEDWLDRLVAGFSLRGILLNPGAMVLIVSMATIAGTIQLWNQHQSSIVDQEDFVLTKEKIRFTEPPDWVDQDLRDLTVTELTNRNHSKTTVSPETANRTPPPSLLDTDLISQTENILQSVGWIENISQISKSNSGVEIDLAYRTPVGLVELNRKTVSRWPLDKSEQLVPVDRSGIVMPNEVRHAQPLLRITIYEPQRKDHFGDWTEWPDDRIEGCAAIGDFLKDRWQEFGFYRVMSYRPSGQPSDANIPYQLWTDTRQVAAKVIWGNPPGKELPGEASAKAKLELLEKLYAEQGPLNQMLPVVIDLRSGIIVTNRDKTASR